MTRSATTSPLHCEPCPASRRSTRWRSTDDGLEGRRHSGAMAPDMTRSTGDGGVSAWRGGGRLRLRLRGSGSSGRACVRCVHGVALDLEDAAGQLGLHRMGRRADAVLGSDPRRQGRLRRWLGLPEGAVGAGAARRPGARRLISRLIRRAERVRFCSGGHAGAGAAGVGRRRQVDGGWRRPGANAASPRRRRGRRSSPSHNPPRNVRRITGGTLTRLDETGRCCHGGLAMTQHSVLLLT